MILGTLPRVGLAVVLAASTLLLACERPPEGPAIVRLAEVDAPEAPEPLTFLTNERFDPEPRATKVDLSAVQYDRLRIRGRGDAELVKLTWKLSNESRTPRYRALSFPVNPDGEEHVYEVDLSREAYWAGHVHRMTWSTTGGSFEALEVIAQGSPGGYRTSALGGVSVPVLPGSETTEITLPQEVPRRAVFETRYGLLPRFDRQGIQGRFRIVTEDGDVWMDTTLEGGGGAGWNTFEREVAVRPGMRLTFEVKVTNKNRTLPDGTALWGSPTLRSQPPREVGPNLVVLVIDTLRADFLGLYGDGQKLSPNLDRLAAESVVFDQLLAPSPWTLPSTATLLTGFHPQTHGAGRLLGSYAPTGLIGSVPTLAQTLAQNGYRSVGIYNNVYLVPSFGLDRGFDEYAIVQGEDEVIIDRALERLDDLQDESFFLFLHLFGPHHPYSPAAEDCQRFARGFDSDYQGDLGCSMVRKPYPEWKDRAWIQGLYRAEIATTDRQIGRLLTRLDELGLDEDTVLMVVSDHGETFWERFQRFNTHAYRDQDHGNHHYQELLRVPGILKAPGLAPRRIDDAVELADVFPTLTGVLGVESPRTQGIDLAPVLAGERPPRRTLVAEGLLYGPPRWAVRRGPWKLIVPEDPELPRELYNLEEDPAEEHDRIADHPDIAASLYDFGVAEREEREALRRELRAGEDVLDSTYLEWNHITKLRALGYLQ